MSFGYSATDLVSLAMLSRKLYKSCKSGPISFANLSSEFLSLHVVLKEAGEILFPEHQTHDGRATGKIAAKSPSLSPSARDNLRVVADRCNGAEKWQSRKFTPSSADSRLDSSNDKLTWHSIRKELVGIGITIAAFDANREFIWNWFAEAVESGAFQARGRRTRKPITENILSQLPQQPLSKKLHPKITSSPPSKATTSPHKPPSKQNILPILFPSRPKVYRHSQPHPLITSLLTHYYNRLHNDPLSPSPTSTHHLIPALRAAATHCHTEIIRHQIATSASSSTTRLQAASFKVHTKIVTLLPRHNADPNVRGYQFGSAGGGIAGAHMEIVKLLVRGFADVGLEGGKYGTLLKPARHRGNDVVVKVLVWSIKGG
ncbi:hypothetical protein ACJ72_05186 [Emergomyces africanus]|uniref:Uncharacterized protein n=1 Tax=Emergomyces africanus TaxID=1955775 RepID=A0A1B7NUZ9_9EURO|nr:hypothetical protein ACJ72_05186 [Emergomyces africanus]